MSGTQDNLRCQIGALNKTPEFMTPERIMGGEEYVSYADYLLLQRERNQWRACAKGLAAAASDMQSGWFYIQEVYGRLSGVGWDRTAQGVEAALAEFERLKEATK